jgi:hypothetical protein
VLGLLLVPEVVLVPELFLVPEYFLVPEVFLVPELLVVPDLVVPELLSVHGSTSVLVWRCLCSRTNLKSCLAAVRTAREMRRRKSGIFIAEYGWMVRGSRWCRISRPANVFDPPPPHPPLRLYTNMPIVRKAIFSIFFGDAHASDYRVRSGTISSLSRAVVTKDIIGRGIQ